MRLRVVALTLLGLAFAGTAEAGWYVTPAVKWSSFAARPEGNEPTPNYYGYGGALSFGYSAKQVFDLGAYGQYLPGTRREADPSDVQASLVSYGGELGLRIAESVYLGFRGGASTYHMMKPDPTRADELTGTWSGSSGGMALGAVSKVSKNSFFQTSVEFMQHVVANAKDSDLGKRRFDSFALSVQYVFNSEKSYLIENTMFKNFLDSMAFF
jgi:hypothetical protein